MRLLINLTMILSILIVVAVGVLVLGNMIAPEPEPEDEYVHAVLQPDFISSAELQDPASVYSKMYELHQQKVGRNKILVPYHEELDREMEEYISKRENWVRYIDDELIIGYDPRYDDIFDPNDQYLIGRDYKWE